MDHGTYEKRRSAFIGAARRGAVCPAAAWMNANGMIAPEPHTHGVTTGFGDLSTPRPEEVPL